MNNLQQLSQQLLVLNIKNLFQAHVMIIISNVRIKKKNSNVMNAGIQMRSSGQNAVLAEVLMSTDFAQNAKKSFETLRLSAIIEAI